MPGIGEVIPATVFGGGGRKVTVSAGTAVALSSSSIEARAFVIAALLTNTNPVYIGDSAVKASSGSERGIPLLPGEKITLDVDNAMKIFLDSVTSGEGVTFEALKN